MKKRSVVGKKVASQPASRRLSVNAFRALIALKDTGGISETARVLGISQPAVSRKMQVFLDAAACGSALLRRKSGRFTFTDAGEAVIPSARDLVARYDRLIGFLQGETAALRLVTIGSGSFVAEYYLSEALVEMRKIVRYLQTEIRMCSSADRVTATALGNFALSIVSLSPSQIREHLRKHNLQPKSVVISNLGTHPVCLLAKTETAWEDQLADAAPDQVIASDALEKLELIGPGLTSSVRQKIEIYRTASGPQFIAEGGGWATTKELARKSVGIGVVPMGTLHENEQTEFVVRRLSKEFAIQYRLILYAQLEEDAEVQRISKAIKSVFQAKAKAITALEKEWTAGNSQSISESPAVDAVATRVYSAK